jgi:hypothetical protein
MSEFASLLCEKTVNFQRFIDVLDRFPSAVVLRKTLLLAGDVVATGANATPPLEPFFVDSY